MRFEALEVSLDVIRQLRPIVAKVRTVDPDLYRQIRKAGSSTPMNLAEGAARRGKDRAHHYRIAEGSAREVHTALRVSEAWGDLEEEETQPALKDVDRLVRMIWGLNR